MFISANTPCKFEYCPSEHLLNDAALNAKLELFSSRKPKAPAEKTLIREKIDELAVIIFKAVNFVIRPFRRPVKWLQNELSIIGFWLIYSKSVSYSLVREVYTLAIPQIEHLPSFSKTPLIESLLESDELFTSRARLLACTFEKAKSTEAGIHLELLASLPNRQEIRRIFQCQMIARHLADHLLEQATCKVKIPENAELACQVVDDLVENVGRLDDLTLHVMEKCGIDTGHYFRILFCFQSANITSTNDRKSPFTAIYSQTQSCIDLHVLSERLERIIEIYSLDNCWDSEAVMLSESMDLKANDTNQAALLIPDDASIISPPYSAVRDIVNRVFKEFVHIYDCIVWSLPCESFSFTSTAWSMRMSTLFNSLFEQDREQRLRQIFYNYILSAATKVPELLDPLWFNMALKHFEAWQSLSYLLESFQKVNRHKSISSTQAQLTHEDFLFCFMAHSYCKYRYKQGLKESYQLLQDHLPQAQIERSWLQNTARTRLHFCDAHTLRMLTRLQKNPLALQEILRAILTGAIPQEAAVFEKHFDWIAPNARYSSITRTPLGVQTESYTESSQTTLILRDFPAVPRSYFS